MGLALLQEVHRFHYRTIYVYGDMILINMNNDDDDEEDDDDDIAMKTVNRPIVHQKMFPFF